MSRAEHIALGVHAAYYQCERNDGAIQPREVGVLVGELAPLLDEVVQRFADFTTLHTCRQ
jgi:hypothetical protein